ncbi:MAG: lipoprotein-releasing system transmembrane subunit LolC, partial [Alphaproteobacteria bacterium]
LRGVPGVVSVSPTIEGQVMATANGASVGTMVRGMRRTDIQGRAVLAKAVRSGSLEALQGADTAMIGDRMAEKLGVMVGDR